MNKNKRDKALEILKKDCQYHMSFMDCRRYLESQGYKVPKSTLSMWIKKHEIELLPDDTEYKKIKIKAPRKQKDTSVPNNLRYEETLKIAKSFTEGKTIQEISEETGIVKSKVLNRLYTKDKDGLSLAQKLKIKRSYKVEKLLGNVIDSVALDLEDKLDHDNLINKLKMYITSELFKIANGFKDSGEIDKKKLRDLNELQKAIKNISETSSFSNRERITLLLNKMGIESIQPNDTNIQINNNDNKIVINDFISEVLEDD